MGSVGLINIWLCFNTEISAGRKLTKTRTLLEAGILDVHPLGNNSPDKTSARQHWEVPGSLSGLGSGWGKVSHENLTPKSWASHGFGVHLFSTNRKN